MSSLMVSERLRASSPSEGFTSSQARLSRTRKKTRVRGSLILNSLGWSMSFPGPSSTAPSRLPGNSRRTLETKLHLDWGEEAFVCCGKRKGGGGAGKKTDDPRIFGRREASFSVVLLTYKREYVLADKACALLVRPCSGSFIKGPGVN